MATNFFWIGHHFEESRSQVAFRKKINFTSCTFIDILPQATLLTPISDQDKISPNNIDIISSSQEKRIKKNIN